MQVVNQSYEIKLLADFQAYAKLIEDSGRTAYQTEGAITDDSYIPFIGKIRDRNHGAVLEHSLMTVKFITDRGVSHELVRHRLASFTQESTRYVSSHERPLRIEPTSENIIDLYNQGFSMKKISQIVKPSITEDAVYYHLKKNKISIRKVGNRGNRNEAFFTDINSSIKAYLLGLIQADGSLGSYKRHKSHQISIIQKNGWFIERILADFLGVRTQGHKDQGCSVYSFSGERWYTDLIAKGIIPNKTYDQQDSDIDLLWNSVPTEFKWDFIRGFLDGDGTLRFFVQENPGQCKSFQAGLFGHKHLLEHIDFFLQGEGIATQALTQDLGCKNNAYRLGVGGYDNGIMLCTKMYKNYTFPYGKPEKVERVFTELPDLPFKIAEWGSSKFIVIRPVWYKYPTEAMYVWAEAMSRSEESYKELIELGWSPQQARAVLPNSLKTSIVVSANFREWLHIFQLRGIEKAAHPQMRDLIIPLYEECRSKAPYLFDLGDPE